MQRYFLCLAISSHSFELYGSEQERKDCLTYNLHYSVENENIHAVKEVVQEIIDFEYYSILNEPNKNGSRPLHTALQKNKCLVASFLIQTLDTYNKPGLQATRTTDNATPLHIAKKRRCYTQWKMLIDCYIRNQQYEVFNVADNENLKPLDRALQYSCDKAILYLIHSMYSACPDMLNRRNSSGCSYLERAVFHKKELIEPLLLAGTIMNQSTLPVLKTIIKEHINTCTQKAKQKLINTEVQDLWNFLYHTQSQGEKISKRQRQTITALQESNLFPLMRILVNHNINCTKEVLQKPKNYHFEPLPLHTLCLKTITSGMEEGGPWHHYKKNFPALVLPRVAKSIKRKLDHYDDAT